MDAWGEGDGWKRGAGGWGACPPKGVDMLYSFVGVPAFEPAFEPDRGRCGCCCWDIPGFMDN